MTNAKQYREDAIKEMTKSIKESDRHGVPPEEIWEMLNEKDYCYYCTKEDKVKAFEKAGFTVEFE